MASTIIIRQGPRIDVVKLYRESRTTVVSRPGSQGIPGTRITASIESEPPVDPRPGDFWVVLPDPP